MDERMLSNWKVNQAITAPLAEQLAGNIRWSISTGRLMPGDGLPPLRELAEKLGLGLNTVRAAYKILEEEGLLVVRPYHGTTVSSFYESPEANKDSARDVLSRAVLRAMELRMSLPDIKTTLDEIIESAAKRQKATEILFVECSKFEAKTLSAQLARALRSPVDYVLVNEFSELFSSEQRKPYRLIVTSFFHYAQVAKMAARLGIPVFGVVVDMPEEALKYMYALPKNGTVGIICGREHALQYLVNFLREKNTDIGIITAYADEQRKINSILTSADVVFMTPEYEDVIERSVARQPIFYFIDHINEHSVQMLKVYFGNLMSQEV